VSVTHHERINMLMPSIAAAVMQLSQGRQQQDALAIGGQG